MPTVEICKSCGKGSKFLDEVAFGFTCKHCNKVNEDCYKTYEVEE